MLHAEEENYRGKKLMRLLLVVGFNFFLPEDKLYEIDHGI